MVVYPPKTTDAHAIAVLDQTSSNVAIARGSRFRRPRFDHRLKYTRTEGRNAAPYRECQPYGMFMPVPAPALLPVPPRRPIAHDRFCAPRLPRFSRFSVYVGDMGDWSHMGIEMT